MLANEEIRKTLKEKKIPMWKLAKFFSVSEMTISRKFREEFTADEREQIIKAIEAITAEKGAQTE